MMRFNFIVYNLITIITLYTVVRQHAVKLFRYIIGTVIKIIITLVIGDNLSFTQRLSIISINSSKSRFYRLLTAGN